jgi:hypothetical protein
MKLSDYVADFQHNDAIDAKSLEDYAAMVKSLNDLIMKAANEKLDVNDEPSDYLRLVLRSRT